MTYQPKPKEFAAIYARKSTKMESYSLETQASLARKLIEQKNLFVYDVYEDEESATKFHPMHRSGFKRLLYDAIQGKFKTVVVFRRDRLARRIEDLLEIKRLFKKHDIKILFSNQGEFQTDEDSYISGFIENVIMSVDELEPGILRERIIAGKDQKRLRGEYSGREPMGYTSQIDGEDKKEIIPSSDSVIIKDIFSTFQNNVISENDFNNQVKELSKRYKSKKFNKKRIIDILLRPLYGGLITVEANQDIFKTINIDDNCHFTVDKNLYRKCTNLTTPIITEDDWYTCLLKLNNLLPKVDTIEEEKENYLFKNIAQCHHCHETIYLSNRNYKCVTGCINAAQDVFEDTLLKSIIENIHTNRYIKTYQENKAIELKAYIDDTETAIDILKKNQDTTLKTLIENYTKTSFVDYSYLNTLIKQQNDLNISISKNKEAAVRKNIAIEKLKSIIKAKGYGFIIVDLKANFEITQELFKSIIKSIVVYNISEVNDDEHKFHIDFTK